MSQVNTTKLSEPKRLSFEEWKAAVLAAYPKAQFTEETGAGETYGDIGDWTAHLGPDMQCDECGVYCFDGGFCRVGDVEYWTSRDE